MFLCNEQVDNNLMGMTITAVVQAIHQVCAVGGPLHGMGLFAIFAICQGVLEVFF
jgi:hypothetical protein